MPEQVWLREVGLRDGLQNIAMFMPTQQKKDWISAEFAAGVREIEVTSYVPPKLLPQFVDAEEVTRHALAIEGLAASALIPNLKGAQRGMELGVPQLNYVQSVSESHNQANVRRSTRESVDDFKRIIALRDASSAPKRIRIAGGLSTAFGCTIEGSIKESKVLAWAEELLAAGADELIIADTVGYANPAAVKSVFGRIVPLAGSIPVSAHFHDTRGLGLANVLAALDVGIRRFDASLGGLGGCPYAPGASGNIAMEDCAFMLESMGFATGIDLARLLEVRRTVEAQLAGITFYGSIGRAGLPKGYQPRNAAAA
ncbi:MAG: hydroxymethylglutaryl-CoA lyase [Xanthobacteraceae bacterium]